MGCRLAFQTPCQFRFPRAEGRVREESPKSAELCVAPRRGGVGSCVRVPPTGEIGIPIPAPDLVVPYFSQKVALPCAIGRGSRSAVCSSAVDVCFAFLTDFPRGRGRRGRLTPPKTERGVSVLNEFAPNLPRSVFRLRRASPPPLGHCPCGARRAVARVGGVARGGDAEAL